MEQDNVIIYTKGRALLNQPYPAWKESAGRPRLELCGQIFGSSLESALQCFEHAGPFSTGKRLSQKKRKRTLHEAVGKEERLIKNEIAGIGLN